LRVLQEGEFERVGGTETIKVDVRIIAATNKDLEKAMEEDKFRQDLYYRLNVIPIEVPPLRERGEDIKYLIYHFMEKFNKVYGKNIKDIEPKALTLMEGYSYPGNIRELENLIERIIVLDKKGMIRVNDLPAYIRNVETHELEEDIDLDRGLNSLVEDYEKKLIISALEKNNNNKVQTAKQLDMNRSTFMSKIKKYDIK
jgi:two-component system response regulator AtoC